MQTHTCVITEPQCLQKVEAEKEKTRNLTPVEAAFAEIVAGLDFNFQSSCWASWGHVGAIVVHIDLRNFHDLFAGLDLNHWRGP